MNPNTYIKKKGFEKGAAQLNLRLLNKKFRNDHKPLFYSLDFKKAFNRVWQEGMCAMLRKFNISQRTVNAIEALHEASPSAVMMGGEISN